MKFCKNLQRIVDVSDSEWAPYWTNYKMLKKLIKELPSLVPSDDNCEFTDNDSLSKNIVSTSSGLPCNRPRSESSDSPSSPSNAPVKISTEKQSGEKKLQSSIVTDDAKQTQISRDMGKSPGEVAFFKLLHAELKKASYFFKRAQEEFSIREERIREGVEIMSRPSSIMVNEKWSCLAKSLYRLYKDLLLLETFAIMSYCSFSKILKKHDKVTGYKTRAAFMANMVNKASFTNYPKVLEMIRRCESSYEKVSRYLVDEGNEDLCEDEQLFINTIHKLNGQIMDKAEEEGAPDVSQLRERHRKRKCWGSLGLAAPRPATKLKTSSLQSLVEENDDNTDKSSSVCPSYPDEVVTKSSTALQIDHTSINSNNAKHAMKTEENGCKPNKRPKML